MTGEVLREGESRVLTCQVMGGHPHPWVTWYRHGRPINLTSMMRDTLAVSLTSPRVTSRRLEEEEVRVKQLVRATREEDGAVYECRVNSHLSEQSLTTNVTLTVHYAPSTVTVKGPRVMTDDQHLTLTCFTNPAKPPAAITWLIQGTEIGTGLSTVREDEGGGWVTSSKLTHHLPESHNITQVTAECRAHHSATRKVINKRWSLKVIKRPGKPVVKIEGGDGSEVVAGSRVRLLCSSLGGRPQPSVTWVLSQ
ncbi:nephrin-like [Cherax quadricarinatus]|uniref:nephrin-like n=1 Tax=Cherax quadricarinatus TaxID=27406 RepID=UPI0023787885|nr:nephrin-like [Cherax quadricarinatus]